MQKYWKFLNYRLDGAEKPLIVEWYDAQDANVQAEFDIVLSLLAGTKEWTDSSRTRSLVKAFGVLTGKHAGLCELRFYTLSKPSTKRRFRPAGIWRPDDREFIILLVCEKSGRIYTPLNAFDTALKYKSELEQGRGYIDDHF